MGGFFDVDLAVLRQFASALRDADEHLRGALRAMSPAEIGQIGGDELNKAADEFQQGWQHGMRQLGSLARDAADRVAKAHGVYQQVEADTARTLHELTARQ